MPGNITETEVFDWANSDIGHHLTHEEILNFVNETEMDVKSDDNL